jgi:hypothetical protein
MVATIEGQLAELTGVVAGMERPAALVAELRVSWSTLLRLLPVAEPAVRHCPICKRVVQRRATFCGTCFSRLSPPVTSA